MIRRICRVVKAGALKRRCASSCVSRAKISSFPRPSLCSAWWRRRMNASGVSPRNVNTSLTRRSASALVRRLVRARWSISSRRSSRSGMQASLRSRMPENLCFCPKTGKNNQQNPERRLFLGARPCACGDGSDRLDRVRVARGLVVAIADHAREAQREATRIATARLQLVERDLDHELRPYVHDVVACVEVERERLEPLRLPREHLVGEPLERLAEHHEAVVAARAEMQITEPASAPAVAPFGCEHHEVERVRDL